MTKNNYAVDALVTAQKHAHDFIDCLDRLADQIGDTNQDVTEMQALANGMESYTHLALSLYSRRMLPHENPPTDDPTSS